MRRLFSVALLAFVVVAGALKIAEWACENWWMDSLGFGAVQMQYWVWRIEAFTPPFLIWLLVMTSNVRLAWHNARWRDVSLPLLGPRALAGRTPVSAEDRVRLDALAKRSAQAFIVLSALLCGVAAANHFDLWVLAFNPPTFAPDWGGDETQFLVALWPAFVWAWDSFGVLLLLTLGMVISVAAFEGVLDFDTRGLRVGDATGRHLAFCISLLLVWIGLRCGLALLGSSVNYGWYPSGISGFYDRSFTNPTRAFFLVSSIPLSLWFTGAVMRRPTSSLAAAFLWSLGALFLPLIAPSFGRAVWTTSPAAQATLLAEQKSHIEATRRAWGLDRVQTRDLKVESSDILPLPPSSGAEVSVPGAGIWPQEAIRSVLAQEDIGNGLGRYASEVFFEREGDALEAQIIASKVEEFTPKSALELERDAGHAGRIPIGRREVGEVVLQSPLVAQTSAPSAPPLGEFPGQEVPTVVARVREFDSENAPGVSRSNALVGMAMALHFSNRALLDTSKPVTWHLDPLERVETLAPFVTWTGARPHPVWVGQPGEKDSERRLYWLVEGCFTARSFPGAAMLPSGDAWSGINYARQSVLGVCDATTGATQFFLFDPREPFSRAWSALLPGFFRPLTDLPAALRAGTRLSPALQNAQAFVWTRYHTLPNSSRTVSDWANNKDDWRVPPLDSSAPSILAHPVLIEWGGRKHLEQLTAFSPSLGVLPAPGSTSNSVPLRALLSAQNEGEVIWKNAGHAPLMQWVSRGTVGLPVSNPIQSLTLRGETFTKVALVPTLDARGNCVGLLVAEGEAQFERGTQNAPQWVLQTRISSTAIRSDLPRASPTHTDANWARLRDLWKSWKSARAAGRWAKVEELERELNHALAR